MHNKKLFFCALTSSLAGFLFGFDTVVISGAEKIIQSLWGLDSTVHGLAISMALWGTVVGSLIGGWPTERLGRRTTLLSIGVLYLISAVGCAYAPEVYSFMVARFIGGLGIGISTIVAPMYISEIAPPERRGRLTGMFQFNIVFGILMAFLSNSIISWLGDHAVISWITPDNAWRWMLGIAAVPSVIYGVICLRLPESPRWLITHRNDRKAGLEVFRWINPNLNDSELNLLADQVQASVTKLDHAEKFFTARLRIPIMLAFLIAFFNQLSGINAILYFAPRIFEMTGVAKGAALSQSIGIGVTNLIFTYIGLWLIDRLGRRTLLYIGSFGYIASLGLCALAFSHWAPQFKVASTAVELVQVTEAIKKDVPANRNKVANDFTKAKDALMQASNDTRYTPGQVVIANQDAPAVKEIAETALTTASQAAGIGGKMVMLCIFAFIAAHAIGQGAVIWVFISEIFPNRNRSAGQTLGSSTHWVFAALLTTFFPKMVDVMPPASIFGLFCFMMVLQLVWVKFMMPETKGIPLEELQKKLFGGQS